MVKVKKLKSKYVVECMAVFCSIMILFVMIFYKSDSNVMVDNVLEDVYFAIYVNGTPSTTFPSRDSGYMLDTSQSSCTNGASILWNDEEWSTIVDFTNYQSSETNRTKCTLYFKNQDFNSAMATCDDTAANCFKKNSSLSSEIVNDETIHDNLRYIGANPNNYVWFNYELWRIVGIFNDIDNGSGTKETRLKIIRDEQIGAYSYSTAKQNLESGTINFGEWDGNSYLEFLLNGEYESQPVNGSLYYNSLSGTCYVGTNYATSSCNFINIGLKAQAKEYFDDALWSSEHPPDDSGMLIVGDYTYPHSNNTWDFYQYSNHNIDENNKFGSSNWVGEVGLMNVSDFGFATSGGSTMNRANCLNHSLYNWNDAGYEDCSNNNWLYKDNELIWTFSRPANHAGANYYIDAGRYVSYRIRYYPYSVYPAIYLKSSVKITGGTGSSSDPYQLSL